MNAAEAVLGGHGRGVGTDAGVGPGDAALDALKLAVTGYLTALDALWQAHGPGPGAVVAAVGFRRSADPAEAARFAELTAWPGLDAAVQLDPLARIAAVLGLDTGERLTVAAAWCAETEPQFAVALGCAHDDAARRYASAGLLRLLLAPYGVPLPAAWEDADRLVRAGVLVPGSGCDGPLRLTPTARRLMAGCPEPDVCPTTPPPARHHDVLRRLAGFVAASSAPVAGTATASAPFGSESASGTPGRHRPQPPAAPAPASEGGRFTGLPAVAGRIGDDGPGAVLLRGPADAGIGALAYAAVRAAGRVPVADSRSRAELALLARTGAGVPVVAAAALGDLAWRPQDGPLVAVGGPTDAAPGVPSVDIAPADPAQRAAHWRARLRDAGFSDRQARLQGRELAARLAFGEEGIDAVADTLRSERRWSAGPPRAAHVWPAVRRTARHTLHRLATPIVPTFTLGDLVVPDDVRAQLDELVAHIRLAALVLDDWGFRRRMPRGQGVAALFSGPPGTGKTMAAEAVAAALEQDLYRVDLSAVVSKYIGETEKNLAAAFDEAEQAAAVLFFDECDGLFGKRTEQRDAHDRWANLEVDFLLQRVESFTGLVVLATNKRAALDEAFLRRLRFSIRFEVPDAAARAELWRRSLPDRTPHADVDADGLARRELAGGSVANAALAAAFLAARDGGVVGPAHLATALRREYDKLGKVWMEEP